MKFQKKLLSTLAVFLIIVSMVLSMSSCFGLSGGHKHSYTSHVIEATCMSNGCTEYICSCGDSYRENETGKGPHRNTTTYEYPTASENGSKTTVCSICGHTETETIESMFASNPKAYEILANLIGQVECTLKTEESSTFTYVIESDNDEYPGSTTTITIEGLEASLDGPYGGELYFSVIVSEVCDGITTNTQFGIALQLLEDVVQFTVTQDGDSYTDQVSLNDLFYEMIGGMMGVEKDEAVEICYLFTQLAECLPIVEGILDAVTETLPEISEDFTNKIVEALELVGEDILVETENADGSITYKVDLAALNHILDLVNENQSLESYLADLFGDKYVDDVLAFIESIPDRTVREISEFVIDAAEAADAPISDLYYVVDLFVYMSSGQKISIEKEIYDRYNLTIAELLIEVGEVPAENAEEFVSSMREALANIVEAVKTTTVGDVINSLVGYTPEDGTSLIENLKSLVDQLPAFFILEFTIDADGQLVALNGDFAQGEFTVALSVDGGVTNIAVTLSNGIEFVAIYSDNQAELMVKENGVVILTGMLIVEEIVDGENVSTTISATIGDENATISAVVQFVTTEEGATGYAMAIQGCEGETVMFDFLYSTIYGENFVTYNIYAESEGEIIVAVDAGLELIESEDKTEYRLILDIGKLPVGSTPVYEDVYETDEDGYMNYYRELVATKTGYLSGSTVIIFGCKQ